MGLSLLILSGALAGWIATIILRIEDGHDIGRYVVFGFAGAIVAGVAAANGLVLGAVTALTLLIGMLGAVAFIAVYHLVRQRSAAHR